jgi:hypothetical protein
MEDYIYYEEQRLSKLWFWVSICIIDLLLFVVLYNLFSGKVNIILTGLVSLFFLVAAGLDIFVFLILKVSVRIDFDYLYISMPPFVYIKIGVDEISFTEITTFHPFKDYGGIGVGRAVNGKDPAYFLSGSKGVRIYYPLSNKLIAGAADPQKLTNAIVYAQQRKKILSGMN